MSDIAITFTVLGAVVVLFVWNRIPVEIVAVGAALSLWATDILTIEQAVGGFGDPTVLFIAALFVVSEGLDSTGVTAYAGQQLVGRVGESRTRLVAFTMLLVALLTALISVNGAVAALVPMVVVLAVRVGVAPSQLLMPLAFGAHAGSMLALTGTPVSVIVSEAANDAGVGAFGFFEFTLVGVPLTVGAIVIVLLVGRRLLPERRAESIPPDLSDLARTLTEQYDVDTTLIRLRVQAGSACIGQRRDDLDLARHPGVVLVGAQRDGAPALDPGDALAAGDVLAVRGDDDPVDALAAAWGLVRAPYVEDDDAAERLVTREFGVSELVVPPRSPHIGTRVFPGMVSTANDFVVLAVQRSGTQLERGETVLAAGDRLLVQGTWAGLERSRTTAEMLVVDAPELVRRQAVPLGAGARRSIVILSVMVLLLATGVVPAVVAALLAAGALVLSRVLTMDQAYRSISWTTVVLVGGMTPLSVAMRETGAAEKLSDALVAAVGDSSPYVLLAGLFVLTAVLGQLISNMATALIVIPIAVTAANDLGVSPRPVLMAVNVAAAAAFITPVATPANLMVMGPGGYRFGDYWKLGSCLLALFFVVSVFLVPQIWSF